MEKVCNIFNCLSGNSQLTEEFVYNNINKNSEEYLILSSSTKDSTGLGYIPMCKNNKGRDINVFKDRPGILIARNGKAGKMKYLEPGLYTINDHAYILSLKEDFIINNNLNNLEEQKLFLKYFIYRYQYDVYSYSTKNDNATWNKTGFFKYCNIDIVSKEKMIEIVKRYDKCIGYSRKIEEINNKIRELVDKTISINTNDIKEEVPVKYILNYVSRNDSLSEEGIYNFSPTSDRTINVLSGSTNNIYYGKIDYYTPKIHKLEGRQCLHIVTRGKAGKLTYVKKGVYATNTNAFLLYIDRDKWEELNIRNEEEEEYYLKYLMIYLQPYFYEVCSRADVSVFPLTKELETFLIPKFLYNDKIKQSILIYNKFQKVKQSVNKAEVIIQQLLEKQIVIK